ncbi:MAG: hypothetical protein EOO05_11525 [Chitinophagaceae bacterium]|nr:MAG: hypothetical protein EOO05_11525 [Chitinophagaceae bacterium]
MPNEASRSRVIPLFVRYAAAAVLIAAVATSAFYFFSNKPTSETLAGTAVTPAAVPPSGAADSGIVKEDAVSGAGIAETESPQQEDVATGTAKTVRAAQASYNTRRTRSAGVQETDTEYQNPLYAYEDHTPEIAERYVTLMTPDGDLLRMSKKLGPLVCCVTGQDQDEQCKNQIRKLQQELASSPVGQGNVLDVLDIVASLNNATQL